MSKKVILLLEELVQELRRQNVWLATPPSPEAMSSINPFCMDTMAFSQWLQWFFVPRMQAIIDQGSSFPTGSNIKPYAEEALMLEKLETDKLLILIDQFDQLMA